MATVKRIVDVPDEKPVSFLEPGQLCNLPLVGRTVQNYEYLGTDGTFLKFRGDVAHAPNTSIVLIPVTEVGAVGLVGSYE